MLLPINTDAEILHFIKNIDRQAITAILEKYGDSLYGIAYHKLQSEMLATNAIKQTFVAVWQQLSEFDEQQDRIFNWVLKIMNRLIDEKYCQQAA